MGKIDIGDKKTLPLKKAYPFLKMKGLENKIEEIKALKYPIRSSSVRRGYFIVVCEENEFLVEFIKDYWTFGKTTSGKKQIENYKKLYHERFSKPASNENNGRNKKIKPQNIINILYDNNSDEADKRSTIEENLLSDKPNEIVHRTMERITEINQNCKNHKRDLIFQSKAHELSRIIERHCTSKEEFIAFSLNLYIMIYETTRKVKSNTPTRGKPFYDYKLPDEFFRNGTETKHFMDIVGTFRHHYAHLEPEYKVLIKKVLYEDALFELLGTRDEPELKVDFQKLQIEVLKLFEASMNILLEIVKNEQNHPPNH